MAFFSRFGKPAPAVPAAPAGAPPSERYRCAELSTFPVGDDTELVYAPGGRSARLLPASLVDVLRRCRSFATLAEHARARCQELGLGREELSSLGTHLTELAAAGLLMARGEILDRAARAPDAAEPPPAITTVGLVTRDRVTSLDRALASYVENARRFGRTPEFAVMDDSESEPTRRGARERLVAIKARDGVPLFYAGREQKERFARALVAETGLDPGVVRFALFDPLGCGNTAGANRNALLLHGVGEMLFSADDDTVCRAAAVPAALDGLACSSAYDPTEFWFFADRAQAQAAVGAVEADVLAAHERLLGQAPGRLIAGRGEGADVDLDAASPRFLGNLGAGRGRVLATLNGVVGDSGMGSPVSFLSLGGASRERLVASPETYRAALTSREVARAVRRPTLSEGSFCMSAFLGLDNRALLPPFFPVHRNGDGIFGATLRQAFEDGYFGFLPLLLLHAPAPPRAFAPDALVKGAGGLAMWRVIAACLGSCELGRRMSSPSERLRRLGRHLIELGAMAPSDFEELVRIHQWYQAAARIGTLEEHLHAHDEAPEPWARDVREYVQALREALPRAGYGIPRELGAGDDPARARELSQRLVLEFGQLLEAWPVMVEGARALRARGVRVAEPA